MLKLSAQNTKNWFFKEFLVNDNSQITWRDNIYSKHIVKE
jgi:hypothetical protein